MAARKGKGANHRSADAVADHFLLKIEPTSGDLISNLKMQKLCYLAQSWSLALLGRPLFDDAIQAWGLGPAIPPLFRRFKPYLLGALDVYKLRTDPSKKLDAEELELLDWVWKKYGRYSGSDLEDITCGQAPWKEAYGDTEPPFRSEEEVTQASMKAYFLAEAKKLRRGDVKDAGSVVIGAGSARDVALSAENAAAQAKRSAKKAKSLAATTQLSEAVEQAKLAAEHAQSAAERVNMLAAAAGTAAPVSARVTRESVVEERVAA